MSPAKNMLCHKTTTTVLRVSIRQRIAGTIVRNDFRGYEHAEAKGSCPVVLGIVSKPPKSLWVAASGLSLD